MCLYICQILIIICILIQPVPAPQQWNYMRFADDATARYAVFILYTMMEDTYADAVQMEQEYNYARFMYEQTPYYEMGYVFGEIIERYKKIVENFKRASSFKNRIMYDYMDIVEQMQKLFFEIYHLVAMMHETPRKYKYQEEYKTLLMSEEEKEQIALADKAFFEAAEQQKKESKKRLKAELAMQAKIDAGLATAAPESSLGGMGGLKHNIQYNVSDAKAVGQGLGPFGHSLAFPKKGWPFPLDYGWEVHKWD